MITDLNEINTETEEGKLLMAALAKLTGELETDKTPWEVIEQLNDLSDRCMEIINKPIEMKEFKPFTAKERANDLLNTFKDPELAMRVCDMVIEERFDYRPMATEYNNDRMKFWTDVRSFLLTPPQKTKEI